MYCFHFSCFWNIWYLKTFREPAKKVFCHQGKIEIFMTKQNKFLIFKLEWGRGERSQWLIKELPLGMGKYTRFVKNTPCYGVKVSCDTQCLGHFLSFRIVNRFFLFPFPKVEKFKFLSYLWINHPDGHLPLMNI